MKYGIDISYYDARRWTSLGYVYDQPTDWDRAGVDVAMIRCSDGLNEDKGFRLNWQAAKGKKPRIAWHVHRYNQDAIKQAAFVWNILQSDFDPLTDRIALDSETLDGKSVDFCLTWDFSWFYEMGKHFSGDLIYYLNRSRWIEGGGPMRFATSALKYKLWLADPVQTFFPYNPMLTAGMLEEMKSAIESGRIQPNTLAPWGKPDIWQFSWRVDPSAVPGHPGIKKAIDYNAFFMNIGTPEPPPPSLEDRVAELERRVSVLEGQ